TPRPSDRAGGRGVMGGRIEAGSRRERSRCLSVAALLSAGAVPFVAAQTSMTSSGPPVQVQPYAPEPGVPLITVNPGTPNPFAGGSDPSASAGGTVAAALPATTATAAGSSAVSSGTGVVPGPTSGATTVSGSGSSLTYTNADGSTTSLT